MVVASMKPMTTKKPARKDARGGDRHKGPKVRAVRVEDDLWASVKERASTDGLTVGEAVVVALQAYVDRESNT